MSPLKVAFTYLRNIVCRFLATPGLCLRTSTLVAYLLPMKESGYAAFWFKVYKGLLYVYLTVLVLRMAAFNVYLMKDGKVEEYLTVEPYFSVVTLELHSMNKYTVGIVSLMALFALYIDYAYNFRSDYPITKMASEMLIENIRQCSPVVRGQIGGFQSVGQLAGKGKSGVATFRGRHLKTFPRLSTKLRIHLVLVTIVSETFVWVANLLTAIAFAYIWLLQIIGILELVPSSAVPFAIIDLTFMVFCTINAIRMTIFSIHTIFLFGCLFEGYHRELQASTLSSIKSTEKAKLTQKSLQMSRLLAQLSLYQTEHVPIHLFEQHLNRQLVSSLMFVTITVNLLVNVVVLNFLLIGQTSSLEKSFIVGMTIAQTLCALTGASILISMAAPLYTCERNLYRAQGCLQGSPLGKRVLTAKLRLMAFFETVCTKKKFTFTAGSMSKISKKAVFQFFFGYSSFFLFIAKLLRKLELKQEKL